MLFCVCRLPFLLSLLLLRLPNRKYGSPWRPLQSGAEGSETIDTKKELAYALRARKTVIVLKMTDVYAEPYAVMQLPSLQSIPWRKGDTTVPDAALQLILSKTQRVEVQVDSANSSSHGGAATTTLQNRDGGATATSSSPGVSRSPT